MWVSYHNHVAALAARIQAESLLPAQLAPIRCPLPLRKAVQLRYPEEWSDFEAYKLCLLQRISVLPSRGSFVPFQGS
jgi:hypothetical protein